ncbi:hypothetical protein DENSPDRAFT_514848 [Dentipellis sp. KUC8613]|nr:hypothetical protein DENSPDRAFT_514848 [Dentipellis sp. KUC8613]
MPPRASKSKPYYTDADLAAPSMTLSYPYADRESRGRATPVGGEPIAPINPPVQHQYNTPADYARSTETARQSQYATTGGSKDTTYRNHNAHARDATNHTTTTTTVTNATGTANSNHYQERHVSRQVREAPLHQPTSTPVYDGSGPADASDHVAVASYERQYGVSRTRHGAPGTDVYTSSTQTAASSRRGSRASHQPDSIARTDPPPTSSSLGPISSTVVQIRPELNYEWTFPSMTAGQASYQQHPSDLAPPADYPSSGTHTQPPSHTRAMGPPPVPTQHPIVGRPRSHSVQQVSNSAAGHHVASPPRSRRISHAVPPTTADLQSHARTPPSSDATRRMRSSSTAHAGAHLASPASTGLQGSSTSKTRKGKERLAELYTREPLQFKLPADNSRPSSFIESDDEGKNGELKKGWRYLARDSRSIRSSAKKMKHCVVTSTESTALTDAQIIAKGADLLANPYDIPVVKRRIERLENRANHALYRFNSLTTAHDAARWRLSRCRCEASDM